MTEHGTCEEAEAFAKAQQEGADRAARAAVKAARLARREAKAAAVAANRGWNPVAAAPVRARGTCLTGCGFRFPPA